MYDKIIKAESEEEAKAVIEKAYSEGYKWLNGAKEVTYYESKDIFYYLEKDKSITWGKSISPAFNIAKKHNLTILSAQEYLNDEVVLESGKYYVAEYKNLGSSYILKANKIDGKEISNSQAITIKGAIHKTYYNDTSFISYKSIRYANQDEIEWLDACIAAKKFIPLENVKKSSDNISTLEQEVKVGDIVVCVDNSGDVDLTYGKEYRVLEVDNHGYQIINDRGNNGDYYKHRFKLKSTPKEIKNFTDVKKGDVYKIEEPKESLIDIIAPRKQKSLKGKVEFKILEINKLIK